MDEGRDKPEQAGTGAAVSTFDRREASRRGPSASAQAILTSIGEAVYEWDVASDRIRWGANVGEVLGVEDTGALLTSKSYDALVHPDSFTNRHQAVMNGLGVDYGTGVPFDVTYALQVPAAAGSRTVWVQDSGVWFADGAGAPYLARGVVRLCRTPAARASAPAPGTRELPRRGAFLRLLASVLAMTAHYRTHHAFVALAIDNLALATRCFGLPVAEELEAAIEDRVRGAVRGGDVAGWLSDTEIGLFLSVGNRAEAEQAVERIVRSIGEPAIETTAGAIAPLLTAGVVIAPFQAGTLEECLSRAYAAQASARGRNGGRVHFFDDVADAAAIPDWELAQALQGLVAGGGALLLRTARGEGGADVSSAGGLDLRDLSGARIHAAARAIGAEVVVAGDGVVALAALGMELVEPGPESIVTAEPEASSRPRQRSRKTA